MGKAKGWTTGPIEATISDHFSLSKTNIAPINIVRSVVDQVIGNCKTEASRKPVVMDEHIACALCLEAGEHVHGSN